MGRKTQGRKDKGDYSSTMFGKGENKRKNGKSGAKSDFK
jgi:hypothetical protein